MFQWKTSGNDDACVQQSHNDLFVLVSFLLFSADFSHVAGVNFVICCFLKEFTSATTYVI